MMKVYVITAGEYSSYDIIGVTLDKGKADAYADLYNEENKWDEARVEVYETDEFVQNNLYRYQVTQYAWDDFEVSPWRKDRDSDEWVAKDAFSVTVFARDKDHAIKAAYDKAAELRAREEGIG